MSEDLPNTKKSQPGSRPFCKKNGEKFKTRISGYSQQVYLYTLWIRGSFSSWINKNGRWVCWMSTSQSRKSDRMWKVNDDDNDTNSNSTNDSKHFLSAFFQWAFRAHLRIHNIQNLPYRRRCRRQTQGGPVFRVLTSSLSTQGCQQQELRLCSPLWIVITTLLLLSPQQRYRALGRWHAVPSGRLAGCWIRV